MPERQDIITAVKNLDLSLQTPSLKGSSVRFNKNGSPEAIWGNHNMVFELTKDAKKWAFRVWHLGSGDNTKRYQAIANYLKKQNINYFLDFNFEEKALLVKDELVDISWIEWVDGLLLKDFIEQNLNNKSALDKLAEDFRIMCQDLKKHQISHGDLEAGNIMVDRTGKLKLIDYDAVCVPEMEGLKELVTGSKGYQHRSRFLFSKTNLKADHFSELIIYLSIVAIAEEPGLWDKYQLKGSSTMLFQDNDFTKLEASQVYKDLHGLSGKVDSLLEILNEYLEENSYLRLRTFYNRVCESCGAQVVNGRAVSSNLEADVERLKDQNRLLQKEANQLRNTKKKAKFPGYAIAASLVVGIVFFFAGRVTSNGGESSPTPAAEQETPAVLATNVNEETLDEVIEIQPLLIKEIKFENSKTTNISPNTFKSGELRNLVPVLEVLPLMSSGEITVQCKIIDNNNNVWKAPNSKYTYYTRVSVDSDTRNLKLKGYPANYPPGKYIFEAWVNERHIGTGVFRVVQ
ncbi:hypothetical protein [Adhaeribacter aquaticus]|uniref:hypothetical protein n=1 Tax=Adhaeribacter aquaticus TaxID=299567 RepID=UPI00041294D1|nr:hypothetical protein [Adhaeribacter aquaticus]